VEAAVALARAPEATAAEIYVVSDFREGAIRSSRGSCRRTRASFFFP